MADTNIRFTISSLFKGEGFTKAANSVRTISANTNRATQAIGALSTELSGATGVVGKVADGMGKLTGVLMSGMGAWAGVALAVGETVNRFVKLQAAIDEENAAMLTGVGVTGQIVAAHGRLEQSLKNLQTIRANAEYGTEIEMRRSEIKAVDDLAAAYKALSAAEQSVSGGENAIKIAQITEEFNAKLREAATEIDKGVIEGAKRLALAQANGAAAIEAASAKVDAERSARDDLATKIADYNALIEKMTAAGQDTTKEEEARTKLQQQLEAQEKNLHAAELNEEAARLAATTAENDATAALNDLRAAQNEEKEARLKAAQGLEDEAVERNANRQQLALLNSQLTAAQSQYTQLEGQYKSTQVGRLTTQRGMAADAKYYQGIKGEGYRYSTDENGNINDYVDWQRAQRMAGRAARDEANQASVDSAAQKAYDRIMDKASKGQTLSDREKKQKEDWEAYQEQQRTESDWQSNLAKAKEGIEKLKDDIKEIKDKLGLQ